MALVRFQFNQINDDEVLLLDLRAVYLGLWIDNHQYLLFSATEDFVGGKATNYDRQPIEV